MSPNVLRVGVFLIELLLTISLIGWLRSSLRGKPPTWGFLSLLLFEGAVVALVAAFVEIHYSFDLKQIENTYPHLSAVYGNWYDIINNFSASAIEELGKYLVAVFVLMDSHHTHRLTDAILYMILIGLGFSLVEDCIFLLDPHTDPLARLLSFYVHSGTSAIIGYSLGRYKMKLAKGWELATAVCGAIGLHFAYNLSTSVSASEYSFYLVSLLTLYISLQVFILFRKSIREEYKLEHPTKAPSKYRLLNL